MANSPSDSFWFDCGISFECTECGACCTGGPGAVFLSDEDIDRFAKHLKLDRDTFLRDYTHLIDGEISLTENENMDCIFLEDNRCSVHEARPTQCRTYPFWFSNLRSEKAWQEPLLKCPGVGRGRLFSKDEILETMHKDMERPRPDHWG